MEKPVLVVMAAGMGSRYGGLKQVEPVGPNGEIIMEYSIFDAKRAGFERVIFVISEAMKTDFARQIRERAGDAIQVDFAVQSLSDIPEGHAMPEGRAKPWGTGHAVLSCRHILKAPFAVINADDFYGPSGFAAVYDFLAKKSGGDGREYAMVGFELMKTLSMQGFVSRGICHKDENGKLAEIKEQTHVVWSSDGALYMDKDEAYHRLPEDALASMNLWGFTADFMQELETRFDAFHREQVPENPLKSEYFLPDVVGQMLREHTAQVDVLPCSERWYGMTYKADREIVREAIAAMVKDGQYPEKLW